MKSFGKITAAVAVAAAGLGMATSSASAYSLTTHLTGSASATHTITFDGAYTFSCAVSFTGVSSGASIAFDFNYPSCNFFGLPAIMTTIGSWGLQVTGGSSPNFTGQITLPSGSIAVLEVPAMGCQVDFTTPQTLNHGSSGNAITMTNVTSPTSVDLEASLKLPYTSNGGCGFSTSGIAEYETNGPVLISGLTIDN